MLFFFPSLVVTRTTGPDSISVKALLSFNNLIDTPAQSSVGWVVQNETQQLRLFMSNIFIKFYFGTCPPSRYHKYLVMNHDESWNMASSWG